MIVTFKHKMHGKRVKWKLKILGWLTASNYRIRLKKENNKTYLVK